MRVLVTGGTGFIGGALLPLLTRNHHVYSAGRRRVELVGVDHIEVDFSDRGWELHLPKNLDAIIHLAQSSSYHRFPDCALDVFEVNVESTARLADYAAKNGVRWLFLASTGSVYEPYTGPLVESESVQPNGFYPVTKLAAEQIALAYSGQFDVCVCRLFFPYGPGQVDRLVPRLVDQIVKGAPVFIDGAGQGLEFTLLHVNDVAYLISAALSDRWQGVVNIASDEVISIRQLARKIGDLVGREPKFAGRDGLARKIVPDTGRLKSLAPHWHCIPLDDGLSYLGSRRFDSERKRSMLSPDA